MPLRLATRIRAGSKGLLPGGGGNNDSHAAGMPKFGAGPRFGRWDGNVDTLYGFHSFMSFSVAFIYDWDGDSDNATAPQDAEWWPRLRGWLERYHELLPDYPNLYIAWVRTRNPSLAQCS